MKKKIFAFFYPIGTIMFFTYTIGKRIFGEVPDNIAYPILIVSVILEIIGITYYRYCRGEQKNPFDFR